MKTAIIIPTIGRPSLTKAIASCQSQEIPPDEIIVVNDGFSQVRVPDGIKLVQTKGREGVSAARRLGTESISPGIQAIGYVDDDDELLPNHISALLPLLKDDAFAFSRSNRQDLPYDPNILIEQNIAPISSFMHTTWALSAVGGWDPAVARLEDWDLWGRMFIEFGPPAPSSALTNVIFKHEENSSTRNQYAYSLMCSWRDIVSDRLKFLKNRGRGRLLPGDAVPRIPKIGVVLPVHNMEKYIQASIRSIFEQDYGDFEIILIDNNCTDNSIPKAFEAANGDTRLRLFQQHEQGVVPALNAGLQFSRSELIARMDADDISMPSRFSSQVKFLEENRTVDAVGTFFSCMDENMVNTIWENTDIPTSPDDVGAELKKRCCVGHPTVMFRRFLVEWIDGYNPSPKWKHVEDYEFWLRALKEGKKIANLPEILLKHRIHGHQVSSMHSEEQKTRSKELRDHYAS